jgi:hypothetical protein
LQWLFLIISFFEPGFFTFGNTSCVAHCITFFFNQQIRAVALVGRVRQALYEALVVFMFVFYY